tara:strand:+ start:405 stop:689 length:285 start_codon:yes stop_codon:yes gene_type:complete
MTTVTIHVTTPKTLWRKAQRFTVSKTIETAYDADKFLRLAHDAVRHGYRFTVVSMAGDDELLEDTIAEIEFPSYLGPAQYAEDRAWKYFSEVRN